jgi:DNA polymerase-3 subunit gamma/tau
MFDQIVSYSGGSTITYKSAIENLNVLDYDYFFRATDTFIQGSYSDTLMLLNEVLTKGFDLGNFLSGLSEHFRNLLVCWDAVTLPLLEVSAGVKSRYQSQSQQCGPLALIRGIDLISQTEISLKSARNSRLSAELGMLKLCGIFKPEPQPEKKTPDVNPAAPAPVAQKPEEPAKQPVINLRGVSPVRSTISIRKHLDKNDETVDTSSNQQPTHSITEQLPEDSFDLEALLQQWEKYTEKLRVEGKFSLCSSLTITQPQLLEGFQIGYMVQNESQLRELENGKHDLTTYLQKQLRNFSLRIQLSKSEMPIKTRPFTADEKLKALEEMNPHVASLRKKLGLNPG